jgi:PAS domain S-box-containing protein
MREHFHPEVQAEQYVVFVDTNRRYVDCSDDVCGLVGYDRTELLKKQIDDLSFDRSSVPGLYEKYIRERLQDGEYILRHKNGAPVLVHYRAWVFADGCRAAAWKPAEDWEQLYLHALVETRPFELKNKVNAALSAVNNRRLMLQGGENPETLQKLRDAHAALRALLP